MSQRLTDTKIPDVSDWGHHPDFRPVITAGFDGDKPRLEKVALSSTPMEKEGLIFGHDVHLSATGGVARQAVELGKAAGYGAPLTCANCHRPAPGWRLCAGRDEAGLRRLPLAGLHPQERRGPAFAARPSRSGGGGAQGLFRQPAAHVLWAGCLPGTAGTCMAYSCPARPVDYVAANVRAAFEPGGTCYSCHTVMPPADRNSLNYGIAPVKLTSRYLPWGDFNHNVPEHHQDANGAPNCEHLSQGQKLRQGRRGDAAEDRRMRHLPRQDPAGNRPPRPAATARNAMASTIRAKRLRPATRNSREAL